MKFHVEKYFSYKHYLIYKLNISAHRIPTDLFYNHGSSKLELLLSPEDTLTMLQLLTTLDQRNELEDDLKKANQKDKVISYKVF